MARLPMYPEGRAVSMSVAVRPVTRQAYEALAESEVQKLSVVLRRALEDWLVGRTRHSHELPDVGELRKKYNLDDLPED
jgi:hypothetical protein